MKRLYLNQRGIAMVLEIVLVVAVLAVVAVAGYHAYSAHHQGASIQADTQPNGKVSNVVNALNTDAKAEADSTSQEATDMQDADSSASDISNVEASFNANQF